MARTFPLAGLLRLRQLQQDQAAGGLAAANARLRENDSSRNRARNALEDTGSSVSTAAALHAVAAARASSRSMLAELESIGDERRSEAARAQAEFNAARAQSVALEKLEGKHTEAVAGEELRAEQVVLDEIASGSWHRDRKDGSR